MEINLDFAKLDAQDILDLAIYVEEEAQENYDHLTSWAELHASGQVVEFFVSMAKREANHAKQLRTKRQAMFSDAPSRYDRNVAWEVEVPDWERLGEGFGLMEALELALASETRARDYYTTALEYTSDAACEEILESLRLAEIRHQEMIRAEMARL